MNPLYKSLFIEKISSHICFVRYKNSAYAFERPFKFGDNSDVSSLMQSPNIKLIDCLTETPFTLYFDDLLMFHIQHENDKEKSKESLQEKLEQFRNTSSQLKFIRGRRLQDLYFRSDVEEEKNYRIRNLKILDSLELDELDDYTKLLNNDSTIIPKLKEFWHLQILEKFNKTIESLDEEIKNTTDESIKSELQSIKDILSAIPKNSVEELSKKTTYEEVIEYWPTLLLPRPVIFDIYREPIVTPKPAPSRCGLDCNIS